MSASPPRLPAHPNAPANTPTDFTSYDFVGGDFGTPINPLVGVDSDNWASFFNMDATPGARTSIGHKRTRTEDLGVDSRGHPRTSLPMICIPSAMSLHTDDGGTLDLAAAINHLHSIINYQQNLQGQLMQEHLSIAQNTARVEELVSKIEQMEKAIEELWNGPRQGRVKKAKIRDTALTDACHTASHFLMDIEDERVDGILTLTLPDPLGVGEEERRTSVGAKIWNPLFMVSKPLQHPANQAFFNAVVSAVLETQKTTPTISAPVLQDTDHIEEAVRTYFLTLCNKYDRQVNPYGPKAIAYGKKTHRSGDKSHRVTKFMRRFGAVSNFEAKHHVKDVALLVRDELMSSEDEGYGSVDEAAWRARALKHCAKGQKALEIHRLECRSNEVSRLYYALDQMSFSAPSSVDGKKQRQGAGQVHARFHGFVENMNSDRPAVKGGRQAIPDYAISSKWLAKGDHASMLTSVWPRDEDHSFEIEDADIHSNDCEALNGWADDEEDS